MKVKQKKKCWEILFWHQFPPVKHLFGPEHFFEFSSLLDVRHRPKLQTCEILSNTNNVNLREGRKT